jgi:nicotinamide-nucleotide adenylyltransferase
MILGIVNPDPDNPPDKNFDRFYPFANPLYYWERFHMITKLLRGNGWASRVRIVPMWHPRISMKREDSYLPPIRNRFWYVPVIGESEQKKIDDFKKLGEEVCPITEFPPEILRFRATNVRQKILAGNKEWESMVPLEIATFIKKLNTTEKRWRDDTAEKLPIIGGRWQPFHNAHLWAIKEILKNFKEVVIGIVNPEPKNAEWQSYESFHPVHNPFTFWERLEMLSHVLQSEGIMDKCCIIPLWHPRKDIVREEAYLPPNRFWAIPKTSAHELEKIAELSGVGEEVLGLDVPQALLDISSTEIKKRIYEDKDWKSLVPNDVAAYILNNYGVEKIKALINKHKQEFNQYLQSKIERREQARIDISYPYKDKD